MTLKKVKLSDSPIEVTDICLGTMTWGEQNSEAEAHAQIDWALDRGINFIDTAEMYPVPPGAATQGRTEQYLGSWLAQHPGRRDRIVLASKIAGPGRRDWIRDGETRVSARTIPWAIDDSLARLRTDCIDLYQIHWPERNVPMFGNWQFNPGREKESTPILEQIEALARAIAAGKIRAYGLSNETTWGLCEFTHLARSHGLPAPVSIQNGYNLVSRTFDGDLAEASFRLGIPLLAYSPLAMGLLTGKYDDGAPPAAARLAKFPQFGERYQRPRARAAAAEYSRLAERHGLTPTALALAFVRGRPFVASTILGATSIAQLDALAASFALRLTAEVLAEIEEIHARFTSPAGQ